MVRSSSRVLSLILFCGLLARFEALAKEPKTNSMAIDGKWSVSTAELAGDALPTELFQKMTLILDKEKYTLKSERLDDTGTMVADTTKKPMQLDIKGVEGPNKGKTLLAIYELDGDSLKICYDLEGKARPTEFKTTKGTKQFLVLYKRIKE